MIKLILSEKIDFFSLYEDIKNNSMRTVHISKNLKANMRSNDDRSIDRSIHLYIVHSFRYQTTTKYTGVLDTQYATVFFFSIMK